LTRVLPDLAAELTDITGREQTVAVAAIAGAKGGAAGGIPAVGVAIAVPPTDSGRAVVPAAIATLPAALRLLTTLALLSPLALLAALTLLSGLTLLALLALLTRLALLARLALLPLLPLLPGLALLTGLPLLPLLAGLALLPLLPGLALPSLLTLASLPGPLAYALVERLQPACNLLRPLERVTHRIGTRIADR
jgi:hypothetical protein